MPCSRSWDLLLSNNGKMPSERDKSWPAILACSAHTCTHTLVKYSQTLLTQEEAGGTEEVQEVFYRGLQIIVFMRLGSRNIVTLGGNECRFVSWLIYTWPWQGKLFPFWMLNSFLFTFSQSCDRPTSKQILMNCHPLGKRHCLPAPPFFKCDLSICLRIHLAVYPSRYPSVHPSICHLFTYLPTYRSTGI